MRIVAVYNIKGGVGKTATTVNLAYLAARTGHRALVWDLDPQGAASFYFRIKPKVKGGSKKLIRGKRDFDGLIKGTDFENLDLLPSDFSYRHMDLILDDTKKPTRQLHRLLRPLAEDYDYLFLDCPPSISLVSENVFTAADVLLLPMIPTTLSIRTLSQLVGFFKEHSHKGIQILPFFSMVDRRKNMHLEVMQNLPKKLKGMLKVYIPYASDVERMGIHRTPVAEFAPDSLAAKAYEALWKEVLTRV